MPSNLSRWRTTAAARLSHGAFLAEPKPIRNRHASSAITRPRKWRPASTGSRHRFRARNFSGEAKSAGVAARSLDANDLRDVAMPTGQREPFSVVKQTRLKEAHEQGYFTKTDSVETAADRSRDATRRRLRDVPEMIIRSLQETAREIRTKREERIRAVPLPPATVRVRDDRRRESVPRSESLGASMPVDAIGSQLSSAEPENAVLDPFHADETPKCAIRRGIRLDRKGEAPTAHGRDSVVDGHPLDDAGFDVWRADDDGFGNARQRGGRSRFNLRGVFRASLAETRWRRTADPGRCSIPADGPTAIFPAGRLPDAGP